MKKRRAKDGIEIIVVPSIRYIYIICGRAIDMQARGWGSPIYPQRKWRNAFLLSVARSPVGEWN